MGEISDNTIAQLQNAVRTVTIDVNGEQFTTRPVYREPLPQFAVEPSPAVLTLHSLTGLIAYASQVNDKGERPWFIVVESPTRVSLQSALYGESKQRDTFAVAQFKFDGFKFGSEYTNEAFIIALQSLFAETPTKRDLLKLVGNIQESDVTQRSDDGVTQSVVAKSGLTRVDEVEVPNPVHLSPYRTFPDIEQPASPFVLRMKKTSGLPTCTLLEADGGAWQNEARQSIKDFLEEGLPGIVIIA